MSGRVQSEGWLSLSRSRCLGVLVQAVALAANLDEMAVVHESIEESCDGGSVSKDFSPVFERTIRGKDGRSSLISAHDDLEQVFRCVRLQLSHSEVIDDQQWDIAVHRDRFGSFPQSIGEQQFVEERMRLAIEHTKPAKDRSHADGLRDVAFANASVSEQENVLMCLDESSCRQFEDEGAVNRVEFPIETVERTMVAKAGR